MNSMISAGQSIHQGVSGNGQACQYGQSPAVLPGPEDTCDIAGVQQAGDYHRMQAKRMQSISPAVSSLILGDRASAEMQSRVTARYVSQHWRGRCSGFPLRTVYDPLHNRCYSGKTGFHDRDLEWGKKYLTASDALGNELWTFGSESMTADPAIDSKGTIYFRTRDTLYAVSPDGAELWNIKTTRLDRWDEDSRECEPESIGIAMPYNKPPVIGHDGTVYVIASDDSRGRENLRVMALRDGKEVWSHGLEWLGEKGPEIKALGDRLYVSRKVTMEAKVRDNGLLGRTRTVTKYVDRMECITKDGTVIYKTTVNEPAENSMFGAERSVLFGIAANGSTCTLKDSKTAQALSPDGAPLWTFAIHHKDPSIAGDLSWLMQEPVFDREGNVYLVGCQRYSSGTLDKDTRVIKLDQQGVLQYDCVIPHVGPKSIAPVVNPQGELAAVVREDRKGPEHIVVISPAGILVNDVKIPAMPVHDRYGEPQNRGSGLVQAIMHGDDGELLVEKATQCLGASGQEHEVLSVECFSGSLLKAQARQAEEAHPGQKVEEEDGWLIVGGVKLQVNQSMQHGAQWQRIPVRTARAL